MTSSLKITERTTAGKREMRKLRHNGLVPGVIYGGGKEPLLVSVCEKELMGECYSLAFLGHIIEAQFGPKIEKFLPKEVVFHPVTGRPIHADFQRVSGDSKVRLGIAVEFINEDKSPGIKRGGVINVVVHKLECLCSPESIPEKIVVDLAGSDIGDTFLLENIQLPDGTVAAHPERDSVIATIVSARVEEAVVTTEDTEAAGETGES
ncbi:MAG: 50S ribosomal protein L25/general stress protein Ctc [Holosporales bacterium]|jgi:large subunit ribosomal protein L25|nr:50S ribosomal protein L25/general stress protein Ctc [Holosporales bacterium]